MKKPMILFENSIISISRSRKLKSLPALTMNKFLFPFAVLFTAKCTAEANGRKKKFLHKKRGEGGGGEKGRNWRKYSRQAQTKALKYSNPSSKEAILRDFMKRRDQSQSVDTFRQTLLSPFHCWLAVPLRPLAPQLRQRSGCISIGLNWIRFGALGVYL